VRSLLQPVPAPALPGGAPALLEGAAAAATQISVQQRMAVARSVAAEDPRRVAQVVRTWVSNDA
jgi:flagellar biosynthesis/type III secretory pathway M-ring protein FliF/YscJ